MMPPLTITLPSDREIQITRQFKAPAELVFDCWTIPALIRRWLGPADWVFVTCEFDARVGGKWRFVTRGPDGFEMGSHVGRGFAEDAEPDALVDLGGDLGPAERFKRQPALDALGVALALLDGQLVEVGEVLGDESAHGFPVRCVEELAPFGSGVGHVGLPWRAWAAGIPQVAQSPVPSVGVTYEQRGPM